MSETAIPKWAMERARELVRDGDGLSEWFHTGAGVDAIRDRYCELKMQMPFDEASVQARAESIARALLKADQDATERAAKVAETAEIEARENRLVKAHMQPDHCSYHLHEERTAQRIASSIRGEGRQG